MIVKIHDALETEKYGEKACYLARLFGSSPDVNIPNGFVISSRALQEFVAPFQNKLGIGADAMRDAVMKNQMPQDIKYKILEQYRQMVVISGIPQNAVQFISAGREKPAVSVIPSPLPYVDGFGRISNIQGNDGLVNAIKRCWASFYELGSLKRIEGMAIIVQKFIMPEKVGKIRGDGSFQTRYGLTDYERELLDRIAITIRNTLGENVEAEWGMLRGRCFIMECAPIEKRIEYAEPEYSQQSADERSVEVLPKEEQKREIVIATNVSAEVPGEDNNVVRAPAQVLDLINSGSVPEKHVVLDIGKINSLITNRLIYEDEPIVEIKRPVVDFLRPLVRKMKGVTKTFAINFSPSEKNLRSLVRLGVDNIVVPYDKIEEAKLIVEDEERSLLLELARERFFSG